VRRSRGASPPPSESAAHDLDLITVGSATVEEVGEEKVGEVDGEGGNTVGGGQSARTSSGPAGGVPSLGDRHSLDLSLGRGEGGCR
jgi:hypothetical protein